MGSDTVEPAWLAWAQRLAAIAQSGMAYDARPYDIDRYVEVQAIAAAMLAAAGAGELGSIAGELAAEVGHATPKLDGRGVVFREGRVLMVQERSDGGRYTLPGGWIDIGETAAEAIVREIREESGYETRPVKLLALLDRRRRGHSPHRWHSYKLFLHCELIGGEPRDSYETSGAGFFSPDELPELSLGRVTPAEIALLYEHYRDPSRPTDVD